MVAVPRKAGARWDMKNSLQTTEGEIERKTTQLREEIKLSRTSEVIKAPSCLCLSRPLFSLESGASLNNERE